mmetsp:Transcript_28041/g.83780  ORF Transcript_28041/g.83780 Transcript_28041/m.83780 type:complete len:91 (-) Transcript_28041:116-388(-)
MLSAAIAAFAAWNVDIPRGQLHEPGRVFCGGTPPGFEGTVHRMLQPLEVCVVRQSPRDDGCERLALLHFTRAAVARCGPPCAGSLCSLSS